MVLNDDQGKKKANCVCSGWGEADADGVEEVEAAQ